MKSIIPFVVICFQPFPLIILLMMQNSQYETCDKQRTEALNGWESSIDDAKEANKTAAEWKRLYEQRP